jgi:hypothetical protein
MGTPFKLSFVLVKYDFLHLSMLSKITLLSLLTMLEPKTWMSVISLRSSAVPEWLQPCVCANILSISFSFPVKDYLGSYFLDFNSL